MNETIARLDDMRLAAALVSASSFTDLASKLSMPKQTVSRRIGALEDAIGVRLVDRTTRTFRVTAVGRGYAERCAEIVRLAEEVQRTVRGEATDVAGTLRVTADPLFGEEFLPPIIEAFARKHPQVLVDVTLTSRQVNLVDEGFDVAFRVGSPGDPSLVATKIADAELVFVASPGYLRLRGTPKSPRELSRHDCIALAPEGAPVRWAFGDKWVSISPRIRVNHLGLALAAARAGLGIANIPSFALTDKLRVIFSPAVFGGIYLVHASRKLTVARTRAFRDIALRELRRRFARVPT
jgi:DNA-binding transcriptional LysR family regulator